jgi:RNA polymerase sigma factor (sigma-70 family)
VEKILREGGEGLAGNQRRRWLAEQKHQTLILERKLAALSYQFREACMTAQERQQLSDLLEKAIRGDEQAIFGVCEFIDRHMKQETMNRLSHAGVVFSVDEAYQEVLLTLRRKLSQLRVVDAFESWLWRLEMSVAKKYRPRYAWDARSIRVEPQASEKPREIGAKTIQVDGKPEIARLFEPLAPQEKPPRRPLFEPLTDVILAKASMSNRPNYPRKIDVWKAVSILPERWALAIQLVYFEGYSRTEAATIMGCRRTRIFKLLQKSKNRLRGLLAAYGRNGKAKPESQSYKVNRRARTRTKRASGLRCPATRNPNSHCASSARPIGWIQRHCTKRRIRSECPS